MSELRSRDDLVVAVLLAVVVGVLVCLWCGAVLSSAEVGGRVPVFRLAGAVKVLAGPGSPGAAWRTGVGPWPLYWLNVVVVLAAVCGLVLLARRHLVPVLRSTSGDGFAGRRDVTRASGARALSRRGVHVRPALADPNIVDLGWRVGRAGGTGCWVSVEDSLLVLGPPRSGKGLHLVIPAVLDAPGAVVTTSTRPDNLVATVEARRRRGPVAVFDPQGLASGVGSVLRWSPIRGCAEPAVAMARARALCAQPGEGLENASFWSQQCYTAVRCLLHAAALSDAAPAELVRWSLSPLAAEDAAVVLRTHAGAAPAWSTALDAVLDADPRQRDSVWAMVANTFAALADPQVLAAVSPQPAEEFDPAVFLAAGGTLYLLGSASGASATATLVSALIEDVVETARQLAARSAGGRVEPPLALVLDEAANYPLPSLLPLMSEGGGSGISTLVVLQSLAQARATWGVAEAAAVWDAAIVKIVLGGSASADDLRDLCALAGTKDRTDRATGVTSKEPVLEVSAVRTLPFGQAIMLLRSVPPIRLTLTPWHRRRDGKTLQGGRAATERRLRGIGADAG